MLLKNNSKEVKNLIKYFESLEIKDRLKLSIIIFKSDLINLNIDKEILIEILKNLLCFIDKDYKKDVMFYYEDHTDIFILAKVMEMNEKEKSNLIFEILVNIYFFIKALEKLSEI